LVRAGRREKARRVEAGEGGDFAGGAAGGFEGSEFLLGGALFFGWGLVVGFDLGAGFGEDLFEAGEGGGEEVGGNEAGADGRDVVDGFEALGDGWSRDPKGEGFEGGVVDFGEVGKRGRGIGEGREEGVQEGWGGVEEGLGGHVWVMYSGFGGLSIGFW
jgi:hypothetical protein